MISDSFGFARGLSLTVESDDPTAIRFYRQEYRWTGQPQKGPPAVRLKWSRSLLPELGPEAGAYHAHKLLARWRYRLSNDPDSLRVEAIGNRFALPMVHHMLVHPGLRQRSCAQGVLLLHGAALVHEGRTVVLTGAGGVGKTTTSALLLTHGDRNWRLHADDYVFLSQEGGTFPYPTRAHLYLDLLQQVPSLRDRLSRPERLRAGLFGRLRRWSRQGVKWPVRVELRRLWPERQLADRGQLAAIFLLRRGGEDPAARPLPGSEGVIDRLVEMNFGEARHFVKLLAKLRPAKELSKLLSDWRGQERAILRALLARTPVFELWLPAGPSAVERPPAVEAAILSSIGEARKVQA